jgi:signal transduction histidine kinase
LRQRLAGQVSLIDNQRRMLQALIDDLHEGVIVAGPDGRIALLNPAAVRLLSVRTGADGPRGLVGRPVESCIPQYVVQSLLSARAAASSPAPVLPDSEPANEPTPLEIDGPGGKVHLHLRVSELTLADPDRGPTATAAGRVVVLTDVTALQRAIQVRSEFVANASHELRTPLATIRAAVEALLDMDLATEATAARQFIDKIDRHSARLEQMVADLLSLSRLEARRERFEPQTLQVCQVLEDLQARFAELLERRNVHWEARSDPPDAATIRVSPYLLRLTLDNLVDNAIKFTEPGGHVTVTFRRTADQAAFEVADDGCGIPPEEQERVFERFYQVQRSRSGPERGTGLGLSIVRHAVHAMHGTVRLESTPGCGTQVSVKIPQEVRQPPASPDSRGG